MVNRPLTGERRFAIRRCGMPDNLKVVSNSLPVLTCLPDTSRAAGKQHEAISFYGAWQLHR